ncbi:hypothetical protein DM02DRAFT_615436 [Periconia macrospinosa]|uniref:Uncharacterized protein n=1 Tax=Periconia macrospinosa TaxID=97972 RepID=A0A2V1DM55_9PLEO|nr:hypothetical protein DM02DRAFT_615436 [Periconia macrospinosa]
MAKSHFPLDGLILKPQYDCTFMRNDINMQTKRSYERRRGCNSDHCEGTSRSGSRRCGR